MIYEEIDKEFAKYNKIEDMPDSILAELIQEVMDLKLTPIRAIPYRGKIHETVRYCYPELVACCPMTALNDTYEIVIYFTPDKYIPELKSLKMYFHDYKNMRISHEHLLAKIFQDFKEAVKPLTLNCELKVAPRGGIFTEVTYEER